VVFAREDYGPVEMIAEHAKPFMKAWNSSFRQGREL
jgi:hypothetical protein